MSYSYCWDVTPDDFWGSDPYYAPQGRDYRYLGSYVRLKGGLASGRGADGSYVVIGLLGSSHLLLPPEIDLDDRLGEEVTFAGRVVDDYTKSWPWIDATAGRFTGTSIAGLIAGATGVLAFAVALRRWLGERRAWRMTDQTSGRRPVPPRVAAQVLFCLEQLERLPTTEPDRAWLWRLRAKVVSFIVRTYGLRDLAKAYVLTDEEKAEIARTDTLLHSPAPNDASTESDEVREVRAEMRRRLQGMTTWGVRT